MLKQRYVFMMTTKQVIPFIIKLCFIKKKLNGKKSVEIHQEVKEPKEPWVYAGVTKRSLGATSTIFREGNRPGVI